MRRKEDGLLCMSVETDNGVRAGCPFFFSMHPDDFCLLNIHF